MPGGMMPLRSRMTVLLAKRSRTVGAACAVGLIGVGVALAVFYWLKPRSKPDATPDTATPPPKAVHEMDPAQHVIPPGPVTGVVGGSEFVAEALIEGEFLVFRTAGNAVPERKV